METTEILKKYCKQTYGNEIVIKTYDIQEIKQIIDFTKQLLLHDVVVTSCCKGTGVIKDEHNDECYCDCEIGTNLMKQQY